MTSKRRPRRMIGLALTATMMASGLGVALAGTGQATIVVVPKVYYLALGDSLAGGYQPTSTTACFAKPATGCTSQGYVNDIYKVYKKSINDTTNVLKLENLGCPGETTGTMINGGICNYAAKATPSITTQLAYAEWFIENNPVAFITIDIGANDIDGCANYVLASTPDPNYATDVPNCVENGAVDPTYGVNADGIAGINTNLATIMSGLESAEAASTKSNGTPIYAMTYYDPFLALYLEPAFSGPTGFAQQSTALAGSLNSALTSDYTAYTSPGPVTMADVQGIFKTTDTATHIANYTSALDTFFPNLPMNVESICGWTWECTTYENIHANATGYQAIADAFLQVMGYLP